MLESNANESDQAVLIGPFIGPFIGPSVRWMLFEEMLFEGPQARQIRERINGREFRRKLRTSNR